jgi:hypothetical protein
MATPPGVRIDPPFLAAVTGADTRTTTQPWSEYHQSVEDRLQAIWSKFQGVTDGSDAAAGQIGEYLTASGSGIGLANNVVTTVATLSLTAGDWDVTGNVNFNAAAGTHTFFAAGIGSVDTLFTATFPTTAMGQAMSTATRRYNVTVATAVTLVAEVGTTSSATASGTISARRAR